MTPQEKTIANKLLADFDGLETQPIIEGDNVLFDYRNNEVDYSDDWNLLVSVAKKIIKGYPFKCVDYASQSLAMSNLEDGIFTLDIDYIFKSCIIFIDFLNSQKEQQCTQPTS